MRIMNQKVEHRKFGAGTIFALKGNKVYVAFGQIYGDKSFSYPEVFRTDMKMLDRDMQEKVMDELREKSAG